MPVYLFSVQGTLGSKVQLMEVAAPDFIRAVQALAAWHPGVNILKLEGVWVHRPAYA